VSGLVEFLRARLDEDQRTAQAIPHRGPFRLRPGADAIWVDSADDTLTVALVPIPAEAMAGHIARHDPARVLADVAAKRAIAALHPDSGWNSECQAGCIEGWPCRTLLYLAAPYADHPDYDEAWRP
jgi:hypothetical protein